MAPLFAGGSDDRSPRRRWTDRILGIVLGLVIGLGVLVYFVFVHSESTIDAPKINGGAAAGRTTTPSPPAEPEAKPPAERQPRQVPVVKVIGGAPPTDAGPKQLSFHAGEEVRFEIETDEPFSFEVRGLGIERSIDETTVVSFPATKTGQFPVIATATSIGVADLRIERKR